MNGDLYLAGDLGFVGGTRTTLARVDAMGIDPLDGGPNSAPTHLLPDDATGTLWISGGFTRTGTTTAHGVGIWHATPRWTDLGGGLPGSQGKPRLDAHGTLEGFSTLALRVSGYAPGDPLALVFGPVALDLPLLGGTLVPRPDILLGSLTADATGRVSIDAPIPPGIALGSSLYVQAWGFEVATSQFAATNGIVGHR